MPAVREALRHPEIRRIEVGWGLSVVSAVASTVTLFVFAFSAGGTVLVAVCGLVSLVPAALATPLLTGLGDRMTKGRLLRILTAARAALLGVAALSAALHAPAWLVIATTAAATIPAPSFRPVQASALPWLARTPAELTAASVTATLAENIGALVGPVLAGMSLAVAGVPTALAVSGACAALAVLSLWHLSVPDAGQAAADPARRPSMVREATSGLTTLVRLSPPGGLLALAFVQPFVRGALGVLIVVLAVQEVGLGESGVGWLNAAIGLGGMLGAALAGRLLRMTRLGRSFAGALVVWGLAVLALSGASTGVLAFAALLVVGIANAVEDGSMFTLLPRLLGPERAGGGLGALELVILLGAGAGTVAAPALVDLFGTRGCLVVLGVALAGLSAAYFPGFGSVDRTLPVPPPEVELLRGLPMFAPLPLVTVERLAADLVPHQYADGEAVVREGDQGYTFHVIAAGHASVSVRGRPRPTLGPGEAFGEIALLRAVPRTATVTADGPLRTLRLGRDEFLAAVTGNPVSAESAGRLAAQRLAADTH